MKRRSVAEYGSYRCWRDRSGIHFQNNAGYSDCAHTVSRRYVKNFLAEINFPARADFNSDFNTWLASLTGAEWDNLHWIIHDFADDNFVWIGTDEIEKWGNQSSGSEYSS